MPRRLGEQVVVITGASSGIGRETAIMLGDRGASVVLAARNAAALHEVAQEVERLGGNAAVVVTDVAEWPQVKHLARVAVERFGRIDTWVNNAAVSTFATVEALTDEEIERVIRVNLLGAIHGVKAALPHLARQGQGVIINVASVLAERSLPLQAPTCAASHGIEGFTESLRLELARDHPDVTVTLIAPTATDTPLFHHARSKLGVLPRPIPPVYEPRVVAATILFAAAHPRRAIIVGGAGQLLVLAERISPALVDWFMLRNGWGFTHQRSDLPDDGRDNLFAPMPGTGSTTGAFGARARSISLPTCFLERHPARQRLLTLTALVALGGVIRRARRVR